MYKQPHFEHLSNSLEIDNMMISYWDEGQGQPLLLLHGIGSSKEYWAWTFHHWINDHRVLALDIPGYGESFIPSVKGNSFDSFVGATEFVKQFNIQLGLEHPVIIGHSMGTGIALQYALLYPNKVSGLVLIAPMGFGKEIDLLSRILILPFIGELLFRPTHKTIRNILNTNSPTEGIEKLVEITYQSFRRKGAIAWHLHLMRQGVNLCGQKFQFEEVKLKELSVPTLIITGQKDPMFPVSHVQNASRVIPDCRLHILENAEHNPHVEYPEQVTRLVLEFIDEISYA